MLIKHKNVHKLNEYLTSALKLSKKMVQLIVEIHEIHRNPRIPNLHHAIAIIEAICTATVVDVFCIIIAHGNY